MQFASQEGRDAALALARRGDSRVLQQGEPIVVTPSRFSLIPVAATAAAAAASAVSASASTTSDAPGTTLATASTSSNASKSSKGVAKGEAVVMEAAGGGVDTDSHEHEQQASDVQRMPPAIPR